MATQPKHRPSQSTLRYFSRSGILVEDATWSRFTSSQEPWVYGPCPRGRSPTHSRLAHRTTGYVFTFHIVVWLTRGFIPMGVYVHYPIISTDIPACMKARKAGSYQPRGCSRLGSIERREYVPRAHLRSAWHGLSTCTKPKVHLVESINVNGKMVAETCFMSFRSRNSIVPGVRLIFRPAFCELVIS